MKGREKAEKIKKRMYQKNAGAIYRYFIENEMVLDIAFNKIENIITCFTDNDKIYLKELLKSEEIHITRGVDTDRCQ